MKYLKQITIMVFLLMSVSMMGQKKINGTFFKWDVSFMYEKKEVKDMRKRLSEVSKKYSSYTDELNIGMDVVVYKDGRILETSIGTNDFNERTIFNIGSATKKMTAILVLQEVEKGNIALSDSIGKHMSPMANVDGSITIEELLRHRSGLGELIGRDLEVNYFNQNDSIFHNHLLSVIPNPITDGRGKYDYCNTNYIILGYLLEKITDQSYFELLQSRIFEPADMRDSYPYVSKNIANLAHPKHNGQDIYESIRGEFFRHHVFAAGSVASSLLDMVKFYEILFQSEILLSESMVNKMVDFDDADYALGMMKIDIDSTIYYGHGGNNIGYGYREYYNPETGDMVLFFTNSMMIPFNKILLNDLIQYVIEDTELTEFNNQVTIDFKDQQGKYFFEAMNMEIELLEKNNNLFLKVQGNDLLLFSSTDSTLNSVYFGIELEKSGVEDELIFRQNGFEAKIKKVALPQ